MAHPCFFCRKRAWDSAAQEAESGQSSVPLQEPLGPWALPFYPRLGDPFRHSPDFLDSLHCFCGLWCGSCSGCGRLLKESCDLRPECPEPQPAAWARMDPQAAAGEAGAAEDVSGPTRGAGALGASRGAEDCLCGGLPAPLPAEPALGLPL